MLSTCSGNLRGVIHNTCMCTTQQQPLYFLLRHTKVSVFWLESSQAGGLTDNPPHSKCTPPHKPSLPCREPFGCTFPYNVRHVDQCFGECRQLKMFPLCQTEVRADWLCLWETKERLQLISIIQAVLAPYSIFTEGSDEVGTTALV